MTYGNDSDKRLNLKDKNIDISYVDNEDIDRHVDESDILDKVIDKLRSEEEDDTTQTTRELEEDGNLRPEDTTQTTRDEEDDVNLRQGEIEDRLRRASDVEEEDMEGGNWARYLSFGVK